jgi:hypothetical protein
VFGVCNVSNDVHDMCIFIFNIYKLEAQWHIFPISHHRLQVPGILNFPDIIPAALGNPANTGVE